MNPSRSDGQERRQKEDMQRRKETKVQRERLQEETKVQRERLQEFKESRDPIFNAMYQSMEKTRKWVTFLGVIVILGLIGTVLFFFGI